MRDSLAISGMATRYSTSRRSSILLTLLVAFCILCHCGLPASASDPSTPAVTTPTNAPPLPESRLTPTPSQPTSEDKKENKKDDSDSAASSSAASSSTPTPTPTAPRLPTYDLTHPVGTSAPVNIAPLFPPPPSLPTPTFAPPSTDTQPSSHHLKKDSDDVVISDDPHALPIPNRIQQPSGFPQPQPEPKKKNKDGGDEEEKKEARFVEVEKHEKKKKKEKEQETRSGWSSPVNATVLASSDTHPSYTIHQPPVVYGDGKENKTEKSSENSSKHQQHDPTTHITPPPTGGWRAHDLRAREKKLRKEQVKHERKTRRNKKKEEYGYVAPPSSSSETGEDDDEDVHNNSTSAWYSAPSISGTMPVISNPYEYKPTVPQTEYWIPDAAHITALNEKRAKMHTKKVHRQGVGARTQRLAEIDPSSANNDNPNHRLVEIRNNMLFVNNEPFWIQGICYSPVPIGESVSFTPKGDYFTPDYAYIWQRDLPMMKAMGATTLRIYGWAAGADHTMFLDAVHEAGLKVLVTYYLGDATQNPVSTIDQRNQILINFVEQVHRYADHPGILMWSFGNELNGAWNGFAKQFSDSYSCWWQAGCAGYSDTNSDCHWQSSCMYYQLFTWINSACRAAKMVTTRPIISGFADVDYMVGPTPWLDKVARFNYLLPDMDAWAVQLYRGYTFGGYFGMYRGESSKPMLVTEFGVDAYNDPCGWPENNGGGCFNMLGDPAGGAEDTGHFWGCADGGECGKPGVEAQAEWDVRLAQELMNQYVDRGGIVWGGFLMAWTDEWWKGGGTQDLCAFPCKTWDAAWCRGGGRDMYRPGGGAMCSWKAHFTCPNFDTNYHDLCGYWLAAAPDNYVNEEWFGITAPINCYQHKVNPDGVDGGYRLDSLYVRPAFLRVMQLWTGLSEVDTSTTTCDALHSCWQCSILHSVDDLNDGACQLECAIKHLAVGPGSSQQQKSENSFGNVLLHGLTQDPDSFWGKFGIPLIIGVVFLLVAFGASIMLFRRRKRMKEEQAQRQQDALLQQGQ